MSTSGSFVPPAVPECAYAPQMTRAAALALRAAGQLNPNCVVVITDHPAIGTPGNTSPVLIELNPVAADDLGLTARVHTNFSNNAFRAVYDIDSGTGDITSMTDDWNNEIHDVVNVASVWPWHLGGLDLNDNYVNDTTLTGIDTFVAAGGEFANNLLESTTLNLTGVSGATSFFRRNNVIGGSFTANAPTVFVNENQLTDAVVSHLGTGAGSFSFQNNTMLTGSVAIDAATTAQVTVNNNVFGGTAGGYRVAVNGKTTNSLIFSGNRCFNQSVSSQEFLSSGTANQTVTGNEIGQGNITLSGAGDATVTGNSLNNSTVNHQGAGVFTLTQNSATQSSVATAAASTRGLSLTGGIVTGSTVTQNGTGSSNTDTFQTSTGTLLQDATVNLNATSAATPATTLQGLAAQGLATVNLGDTTNTQPIRYSRVEGGSTLTVGGGGSAVFNRSQLRAGATLTCNHDVQFSVIEGQFTKTSTGNATNAMCSPLGDTWPF